MFILFRSVAPIQAVMRPKGMGLGADRSKSLQGKDSSNSSKDSKKDEDLEWKKGAYCIIESGKNEGLYGQVNVLLSTMLLANRRK